MKVARDERVRQITNLREIGHTDEEISEIIGLAVVTIKTYMFDPSGNNLRRYYQKRARRCACGGTIISPRARMCSDCRYKQFADRRDRWTRERIIGAFQRLYFEHGVPPTQDNVLRFQQGHYPNTSAVNKLFGSWEEAVVAAGFAPWKGGPAKRKAFE